mgnify:FL=1
MIWLLGWPVLLVGLFLPEPYREQSIAIQTILCTLFPVKYTFQLVTLIFVAFYFVRHRSHDDIPIQILHHCIVVCTILLQYMEKKYQIFSWCLLAWSARWLGSINIYDQPFRTSIKCLLLMIVLKGRWRTKCPHNFGDELKWCWVLFVNECMCLLLPVQILYEVYVFKQNSVPKVDIV